MSRAERSEVTSGDSDRRDPATALARILHIAPDDLAARRGFGDAFLARGRFLEAESAFAAVVASVPSDADALNGLAKAFLGQGLRLAAIGAARRATAARPGFIAAQMTLANALRDTGDRAGAAGAYEIARTLAPGDPAIAREAAGAYRRIGRTEEAEACARRALALEPGTESLIALADVRFAKDDLGAAEMLYREALEISPGNARAESGLGRVSLERGEIARASAYYARAAAAEPGSASALYNQALFDLRAGNLAEGFRNYHHIANVPDANPGYYYLAAGVPAWGGDLLGRRRLLVAAEQGFGDQIMMARFFDRLLDYGGDVTIEVWPPLLALFRRNFPAYRFVKWAGMQPLSGIDAHVQIMHLPGVLGAGSGDLASAIPYLTVDPKRAIQLSGAFSLDRSLRNVGIVWHGNALAPRDRRRAAPLAAWKPLRAVPNVRFHSLQFEATAADCAAAPFGLHQAHRFVADFDDMAAAMSLMDLVISVDTSAVHLAGAAGLPVWMPNSAASDYRWGDELADSPWYPSLRIFRQRTCNEWEPVFEEIAEALRAF